MPTNGAFQHWTGALTPRARRSILRSMPRLYTSFAEFWPFYLREHSKASTPALHYVGTSLVAPIAVAAVVSGTWGWPVAPPLAGYFFAWVAHCGVDEHRPATSPSPARPPPAVSNTTGPCPR